MEESEKKPTTYQEMAEKYRNGEISKAEWRAFSDQQPKWYDDDVPFTYFDKMTAPIYRKRHKELWAALTDARAKEDLPEEKRLEEAIRRLDLQYQAES